MRDRFVRVPFASDGDVSSIPDATQPTGSISMQQGWGADYQKEVGVEPGAKSVDRQDMNEMFHIVTSLLNRWQTEVFPEWIDPASNAGAPYPYQIGSTVRYSADGVAPYLAWTNTLEDNATSPSEANGWILFPNAFSSGKTIKRIFTSSTTYSKPAGMKSALIQVQAGGGGGGGASATSSGQSSSGAGGGGGGFAESLIPAASIASTTTVTVGTGGAGGSSTGGSGSPGTASSFGALVTSAPGSGGFGSTTSTSSIGRGVQPAGAGGSSVGDISVNGGGGGVGLVLGAQSIAGDGGASYFSPEAKGRTEGSLGVVGISYGGGGSGAAEGGSTAGPGRSGGNGGGGIVVITEFF